MDYIIQPQAKDLSRGKHMYISRYYMPKFSQQLACCVYFHAYYAYYAYYAYMNHTNYSQEQTEGKMVKVKMLIDVSCI